MISNGKAPPRKRTGPRVKKYLRPSIQRSSDTLDGRLFLWYEDAVKTGTVPSVRKLQKKAVEFYRDLTGLVDLNLTGNWIVRWKKRHGIGNTKGSRRKPREEAASVEQLDSSDSEEEDVSAMSDGSCDSSDSTDTVLYEPMDSLVTLDSLICEAVDKLLEESANPELRESVEALIEECVGTKVNDQRNVQLEEAGEVLLYDDIIFEEKKTASSFKTGVKIFPEQAMDSSYETFGPLNMHARNPEEGPSSPQDSPTSPTLLQSQITQVQMDSEVIIIDDDEKLQENAENSNPIATNVLENPTDQRCRETPTDIDEDNEFLDILRRKLNDRSLIEKHRLKLRILRLIEWSDKRR